MAQLDLSGDTGSNIDKPLTVSGRVVASAFEHSGGIAAGYLYTLDDTATSLATATVSSAWTTLSFEAKSTFAGMTPSTTANSLTTLTSGIYLSQCDLSVTTTAAGEYMFELFAGGSSQDQAKARVYVPTSTQDQPVAAGFGGVLELAASVAVVVKAKSTAAGSVLLNNGNFRMVKVG